MQVCLHVCYLSKVGMIAGGGPLGGGGKPGGGTVMGNPTREKERRENKHIENVKTGQIQSKIGWLLKKNTSRD